MGRAEGHCHQTGLQCTAASSVRKAGNWEASTRAVDWTRAPLWLWSWAWYLLTATPAIFLDPHEASKRALKHWSGLHFCTCLSTPMEPLTSHWNTDAKETKVPAVVLANCRTESRRKVTAASLPPVDSSTNASNSRRVIHTFPSSGGWSGYLYTTAVTF